MNYRKPPTPLVLGICALTLLTSAGCSDASSAEYRADEMAAAVRQQQVEHFVRTFALEAPTRAIRHAENQARSPSLRTVLDRDLERLVADDSYHELVGALYAARNHGPVFVVGAQLTREGRALAEAMTHVYVHALDPADFHADAISERVAILESAGDISDLYERLRIDEATEETLLAYMLDHAALDDTLPAADAIFQRISVAGPENPLPHFAQAIDELTMTLESVAAAGPELELLLADAFVRFADVQLVANPYTIPRAEREVYGWPINSEEDRLRVRDQRLSSILYRANEEGFAETLETLHPPGDQYVGLVEGFREYLGYARADNWPQVEISREVRVGQSHENIPALRQRLANENYFSGDLTSTELDNELSQALRHYQTTHQLDVNGRINEQTLDSINIPALRRLAQIAVSMDRWRDEARSVTDHGSDFIRVSVPDFHGEFWVDNERVERWRVIVGRTIHTRNARGQSEIRGRTPLFSDRMRYIVFNPYWNVPASIRRIEHQPHIDADPFWLEENGFEIIIHENGYENLRQLPGPRNALGQVKFLFPNEHDVYMHDTPNRRLFDRTHRAFSYGCIRAENPLDLAALYLAHDRGWTQAHATNFVREQIGRSGEQWVSLRTPLPFHIEYFVVRADDDGRMNFLADIYRYDVEPADIWEERLRPLVYGSDEVASVD